MAYPSARGWLAAGAALAVLFAPRGARSAEADMSPSLAKIFASAQDVDELHPWQTGSEGRATGSGAIIAGRRILTNAHVVSNHTYLEARRAGDPRRYRARLEFVAHDCDLALLRVDEPAFWAGSRPLELGALVRRGDVVSALGFPAGGDELSVTRGVISRIQTTAYAHSDKDLLTLQTDAAINPGSSGGPMVKDGLLVGISFQGHGGLENTGYGIPAPMVGRFLRDIEDGRYDGVPNLGFVWNALENEAARTQLRLPPGRTGVEVIRTFLDSPASGLLEPRDVVTAIDGIAVANDGSVSLEEAGRVDIAHLASMRQMREEMALDVWRAGKALRLSARLRPWTELVPGPLYEVKPSYFVYGGLVFLPLTRNFDMNTMGTYLARYAWAPTPERRQVVVLAYVLPDEVNAGYHGLYGQVVESVNGRRACSLVDVAEAFEAHPGPFHVIQLDELSGGGARVVLDARKARAAHPAILSRYRIPTDRSEDLRGAAHPATGPASGGGAGARLSAPGGGP